MRYVYNLGVVSFSIIFLTVLSGCPPLIPGQTNTFDDIQFQWCPNGTFLMGSSDDEDGRYNDEVQHEVTISQGFWLGKYEVTQAQWVEIMGTNPLLDLFEPDNPLVGDDLPVVLVSWNDVQDFLAELNRRTTGATYRLPTESEWEYACRAGTTTRFPWGDDPDLTEIDDYCWYNANSEYMTYPGGLKEPNNWGLHDMCGNVNEWCQDRYGDYPTTAVTDPQGSTTGTDRVGRGGSQQVSALDCRPAWRGHGDPGGAGGDVGFRILRKANFQRSPLTPARLFRLSLFNRLPNG